MPERVFCRLCSSLMSSWVFSSCFLPNNLLNKVYTPQSSKAARRGRRVEVGIQIAASTGRRYRASVPHVRSESPICKQNLQAKLSGQVRCGVTAAVVHWAHRITGSTATLRARGSRINRMCVQSCSVLTSIGLQQGFQAEREKLRVCALFQVIFLALRVTTNQEKAFLCERLRSLRLCVKGYFQVEARGARRSRTPKEQTPC